MKLQILCPVNVNAEIPTLYYRNGTQGNTQRLLSLSSDTERVKPTNKSLIRELTSHVLRHLRRNQQNLTGRTI
ncbi:Hypothetical predicted protein [Octopus vulgaris]|uniref:Uncharacterized protein n=1 Tax=Octopus vulgaris TaxID=6645 RepID=A0AA36FJN3_OCTVU|nr:Hypothetical predicted protein [Octopus vulgaris]